MDKPWLPDALLELFESWDTEDWFMWEWGAGASTRWFGERVKRLWSMEHNKHWYNKVKNACNGMDHVFVMHKELEGDYIKEINRFPNQFFDCILIDGRNRVECVKAASIKSKKFVVLDNALRDRYAGAIQHMEHQQIWTPTLVEWVEPVRGKLCKTWHTMVWERQ